MNSHLTMPWWQHTLLMLAIPLAVAIVVVWWKLSKAGRQESARPLRKRKRRRH